MNDNEYVYEALHEWIKEDPEHRQTIPLGEMEPHELSEILRRAAKLKEEVRSDMV